MKGGREHRVPLSDAARGLLHSLPREEGNPFIFVGARAGGPLSNTSLAMVLRRMGRGDITAHGFRSSFRTWAAEQTSFAREVAEQSLAHTISDKVERVYRRTTLFDKRRKLMDAWASHCASPAPPSTAEVIAIGAGR